MGFLSKLFGKKEEIRKEETEPRFKGSLSDMERAYQVAEEGRWDEALEIVNRVLSLPEGEQETVRFLTEAMMDKSKSGMDYKIAGTDASGKTKVKVKLTLRGGMIPELMAFRGECLFKLIEGRVRSLIGSNPSSGMKVDIGSDAVLRQLKQEAIQYVVVSTSVFWNHPDNLATAAILCNGLGNFDGAEKLWSRALQLDPRHQLAINARATTDKLRRL